jgi:hypothetical protein
MKATHFKSTVLGALLLLTLIFTACSKVIDVDLNSADPQYVVEGAVTKGETVHRVSITRTLNFDEVGPFPAVSNAVVTITDNLGNSEVLVLVEPGIYETVAYPGVEGRTYTITVSVDGKVFTAQSTMPFQVPFDDLTVFPIIFGSDTLNTLVPVRQDPAGIENYYQFVTYENGERVEGIQIQDDQLSDGQQQLQPIFNGELQPGDSEEVIMYCIDKPVFKYFFSLDASNSGNSSAPANPVSNFGKACLGYFSARTSESRSIVIP